MVLGIRIPCGRSGRMYNLNAKYESLLAECFNELRGRFGQEESFHIILGVAAITWINIDEKYLSSNLTSMRYQSEKPTFIFLQGELKHFEYEFPEFEGILTGIMNRIYIYKNQSDDKKLERIFQIIETMKLSSAEEVRKFINALTSIGSIPRGMNQTPVSVKEIITGLTDFEKVRSIADYCSGTSGVVLHIYEHSKSIRMDREMRYYGEEINVTNFLISKLLMIVNGIEDYEIVNKDVLSNEGIERNLKFDFIVSDFPQVMNYDIGIKTYDPRFKYGIPNRSSADWAFCQNVLHHLDVNGKGVVIGTKGTLVRSNEAFIRAGIVEDDLIESVITLPTHLYGKSNIGTEMIVFNKNKGRERKNRILFINASGYSYRLNKNQRALSPEGINKVIGYYHHGIEEDDFSKFVELEKIKEYNYTLNPKEYLEFDVLKSTFEDSIALKDIAEITKGVQVSKEDLEMLSKDPTHYFLNVKDIENGRIKYDESAMLTFKKVDWIGKFDIRSDDIILTSKGSTLKMAIVEDDLTQAFISGNLSRIRVDPRKYDAYVLFEFLQSEVGGKMLEGIQTGTTTKLLNTSQLERLVIPTFDIEFMKKIGKEIKSNKFEYEVTIAKATMKFEDNREKIMTSLGWGISKSN